MIKAGDVYRIKMDNKDGITPKDADEYRCKYIIILGYDGDSFYGAVATNTKDHPLVPAAFQYPIELNKYKCFANCYKLHEVSEKRLTKDCYMGNISEEDIELIIGCVKTSPMISRKTLEKFRIIKEENN